MTPENAKRLSELAAKVAEGEILECGPINWTECTLEYAAHSLGNSGAPSWFRTRNSHTMIEFAQRLQLLQALIDAALSQLKSGTIFSKTDSGTFRIGDFEIKDLSRC